MHKINTLPNFLKPYESSIFQIPAIKYKSKGRATGGVLVICKNKTFSKINIIKIFQSWSLFENLHNFRNLFN